MMAWRDCTLGDVLTVKHGFAFRGEYFGDTGSHIVLTPGNFYEEGGFKRQDGKEKWYRGPVPEDYVLNQGELIVAMTEQAEGLLGSSAIVPAGGLYLHNQRLGLIQLRDASKTDKRFVYYLFNFKPVRQQIRATASGVKIRHTAPSRIADVKVRMPCVELQRRIAEILSAYDDLIENSERRIQILEQMARALYREWFVEFRFPGHEKVRRVNSQLGLIPEGWAVRQIGHLTAFLNRGISPIYDESGGTLVINQKCIRDERVNLEPARRQSRPIPVAKRLQFGDVLINSTGVGTLGRVAQVCQQLVNCTVDTHVTVARPSDEVNVDFFGLALCNQQPTFDRLGTGATNQTELSRAAIASVELVVPSADIQHQFGTLVHPIRRGAITLGQQIQNLRRTRALLLPRLLSGQIALDTNAAA